MSETAAKPFTGRHMLAIMLAFFGVVIAVNLTMAYFASASWTGLVVKNSYVASQEFNETTDRLMKSEAGVHVKLAYDGEALSVRLTDNAGAPVAARDVTMMIGRPSHEGEDRTLELIARGAGLYAAPQLLKPGQWSGKVTAKVPGHEQWERPIYLIVEARRS